MFPIGVRTIWQMQKTFHVLKMDISRCEVRQYLLTTLRYEKCSLIFFIILMTHIKNILHTLSILLGMKKRRKQFFKVMYNKENFEVTKN